MKKLIIAALAFVSFNSYAQTADLKPNSKIALGVSFSPDYSYRTLKSDADSKWIIDIREEVESAKLGYTTGANALINLSNRFSLETGLLFSDKGYKAKVKYIVTEPDPNAPESAKHNYRYLTLDVPLKVNYYITTGKIKAFASVGSSANFFMTVKRTSTYEYANGKTEKKTVPASDFGYEKVDIAALASVGVDYALTENLLLRVEPIYRRSVTSITKLPIDGYLYSAGLNLGVFMKL
ncbi:outer membrane beta-barrel protein [Adhaeribacter soli]|uniref:PorT family protein n=1 Tax=Adhaeribacter soli TaxID=2607655 RepID=A0A5N1IVC9_9BACT|nr:outer membrane beta-barrel protein [Adhaeribacter soli]KAA9333718.1 PorT family protein [Adhaeribacter soli]